MARKDPIDKLEEGRRQKFTDQQREFLRALGAEARGNIRQAMDIAGYARGVSIKYMTDTLGKEIMDIASSVLAAHAPQAAFELVGILEDPLRPGADNTLKASNQILDRTGLSKKESESGSGSISAKNIFILPEKKKITIENDSDENGAETSE